MKKSQSRIRRACPPALAALLSCTLAGSAAAGDTPPPEPSMDALRQMLIEQTQRLDALRRQMEQEQARLDTLRHEVGLERLRTLRAAGPGEPAAATDAPQPVGQRPPPKKPADTPPVAQIFDQPGILTQPGTLILEPSLQYSYASTNRVALVGYTVIPALTIGLIDVREVKRSTWTAALTARTGLTNRLEIEGKIPWVYRSDDSIRRPLASGSANDQIFNSTGNDIGDIEFTARYQLNPTVANEPIYVASLRFKTRTGSDQFETTSIRVVPGFSAYQKELPTGSGFYSIQPGLTFLFPSDPVVFFGGINYQYSFKRSNLELAEDDGSGNVTMVKVDSVQPGGVFGFNFGMGLALNDRSSFSVGYDHASVGVTRINGRDDPLGVRVQLGTLMFGYAYRLAPDRALNVSLGVGVTRDTPDLTLTLRMPFTL